MVQSPDLISGGNILQMYAVEAPLNPQTDLRTTHHVFATLARLATKLLNGDTNPPLNVEPDTVKEMVGGAYRTLIERRYTNDQAIDLLLDEGSDLAARFMGNIDYETILTFVEGSPALSPAANPYDVHIAFTALEALVDWRLREDAATQPEVILREGLTAYGYAAQRLIGHEHSAHEAIRADIRAFRAAENFLETVNPQVI